MITLTACTRPPGSASDAPAPERVTPQTIYQQYCLRCHGDQLAGGVGPNLIDAHWIFGNGSPESISKMLNEGSVKNGMPAWRDILTEAQVAEMAEWILKQQGKAVPRAKAPQGNYVEPKRKP